MVNVGSPATRFSLLPFIESGDDEEGPVSSPTLRGTWPNTSKIKQVIKITNLYEPRNLLFIIAQIQASKI